MPRKVHREDAEPSSSQERGDPPPALGRSGHPVEQHRDARPSAGPLDVEVHGDIEPRTVPDQEARPRLGVRHQSVFDVLAAFLTSRHHRGVAAEHESHVSPRQR
jgi:hypothetical protein